MKVNQVTVFWWVVMKQIISSKLARDRFAEGLYKMCYRNGELMICRQSVLEMQRGIQIIKGLLEKMRITSEELGRIRNIKNAILKALGEHFSSGGTFDKVQQDIESAGYEKHWPIRRLVESISKDTTILDLSLQTFMPQIVDLSDPKRSDDDVAYMSKLAKSTLSSAESVLQTLGLWLEKLIDRIREMDTASAA